MCSNRFYQAPVVFGSRRSIAIFLLTATALSADPALADPISNGTDFQSTDTTGDPFYDPVLNPTSFKIADQVAPFSFGSESGTVESLVYAASSNNPYDSNGGGAVAGALTFVYQINLTSEAGDIASIGVANFGFNQTDVGYYDQTGSQIWPAFVSRDLSGVSNSTVTFSFLNPGGNYSTVNSGETSALLVINTDATTYTNSTAALQDDSSGSVTSYAIYGPLLAPEPSSLVLMGFGAMALAAVGRHRRTRTRSA